MGSDSTRGSLLGRVRDPRDDEAWHDFDATYRELLVRYARRLGLQQYDAEDVHQRVMVRLAKHLRGFEYDPERGRFRDYLRTCVRNEVADWASRRTPAETGATAEPLEALADEAAANGRDEVWESEWRAHHLRHAMAKARQAFDRETLVAFDHLLAGESAKSIAEARGITVDAVHKLRMRVREFLRERIAEQIAAEDPTSHD